MTSTEGARVSTDELELEQPAYPGAAEGERRGIALLGEMFVSRSTFRIVVILIGLAVAFSCLRFSYFATLTNLRNIATDAAILMVMTLGMTFVMVAGGIDISIGSVLVFSGVVSAKTMSALGNHGLAVLALGAIVAVAAGTGWGVINGALVTKGRVPPLIATLGTLGMAQGLAYVMTGGVDLAGIPNSLVRTVGQGNTILGIPWLVIITAVVVVMMWITLSMTRFGRYTYAVGSNSEALRRSGPSVTKHLIKVYGLMGLLAGLAGWLSLAKFATTTIDGHLLDNLEVIAGVVIGGTSLFGGAGTIVGAVIGILIPVVLQNGLIIMNVEPFWENVAVGAVLIAAVMLDQLNRRVLPTKI